MFSGYRVSSVCWVDRCALFLMFNKDFETAQFAGLIGHYTTEFTLAGSFITENRICGMLIRMNVERFVMRKCLLQKFITFCSCSSAKRTAFIVPSSSTSMSCNLLTTRHPSAASKGRCIVRRRLVLCSVSLSINRNCRSQNLMCVMSSRTSLLGSINRFTKLPSKQSCTLCVGLGTRVEISRTELRKANTANHSEIVAQGCGQFQSTSVELRSWSHGDHTKTRETGYCERRESDDVDNDTMSSPTALL